MTTQKRKPALKGDIEHYRDHKRKRERAANRRHRLKRWRERIWAAGHADESLNETLVAIAQEAMGLSNDLGD